MARKTKTSLKSFDVHVYVVARVKVSGVKAKSARTAAKLAEKNTDFYAAIKSSEFSDDIIDFLVDEVDDKGEVIQSQSLNADFTPQVNKHEVSILWGSSPDPDNGPSEYEFKTAAELSAFLLGVEESSGWMDYEVVEPARSEQVNAE